MSVRNAARNAFGGVPTSVATPPMVAPKAVPSSSAGAKPSGWPPRAAATEAATEAVTEADAEIDSLRAERDQLQAALQEIEDRVADMPEIFAGIGLAMSDGSPIDVRLIEPYIELISEVFRAEPPYTFGEDNNELYREVFRLGMEDWPAKKDTSRRCAR